MSLERPLLVVICNALTPYRVHMNRRISRELPQYELLVIVTHGATNVPWPLVEATTFRVVRIGDDDHTDGQEKAISAYRAWKKGRALISILERDRVAAVVIEGYNDLTRLMALRWARRANIPRFVFGDSNIDCDVQSLTRGAAKRMVLRVILRQATGVFACGDAGRLYFERYGVTPSRIFLVPYDSDYDAIAAMPRADVDRLARTLGLAEGRRRILFCGRFAPEKRVDLLIAAFVSLAPQNPDWDLVLVGVGPLRDTLLAAVQPLLSSRVKWLPFMQRPEQLAAIYRSSRILVLPSDREPWGIVVTEAAAAGLALVTAQGVGAARELVAEGETGYLFTRGDSDDLARSLAKAMADCDRLGAAAARRLAAWRASSDPIEGLRQALRTFGRDRMRLLGGDDEQEFRK